MRNQQDTVPSNILEAMSALAKPYRPDLTISELSSRLSLEQQPQSEKLVSRYDATKLLGVSLASIDRMLRDKRLQTVRIRGRVFIKQSCIDSILSGDTTV